MKAEADDAHIGSRPFRLPRAGEAGIICGTLSAACGSESQDTILWGHLKTQVSPTRGGVLVTFYLCSALEALRPEVCMCVWPQIPDKYVTMNKPSLG